MNSRIPSTRSKTGRKVEFPEEEPGGPDISRISIKDLFQSLSLPQILGVGGSILALIYFVGSMSFKVGAWHERINFQARITSLV